MFIKEGNDNILHYLIFHSFFFVFNGFDGVCFFYLMLNIIFFEFNTE